MHCLLQSSSSPFEGRGETWLHQIVNGPGFLLDHIACHNELDKNWLVRLQHMAQPTMNKLSCQLSMLVILRSCDDHLFERLGVTVAALNHFWMI